MQNLLGFTIFSVMDVPKKCKKKQTTNAISEVGLSPRHKHRLDPTSSPTRICKHCTSPSSINIVGNYFFLRSDRFSPARHSARARQKSTRHEVGPSGPSDWARETWYVCTAQTQLLLSFQLTRFTSSIATGHENVFFSISHTTAALYLTKLACK